MATNANVIQAQLAATTAPYEAQLNNLRLDFEAAKKRQAADNAARLNELYIAHEQNKRTLPQQNAALGNTGGLTETSIIDLANTYQRNRNAQNKSYADAIAELDLEYAKSRNTINAQIAAAQAEANAKLAALNSGGSGTSLYRKAYDAVNSTDFSGIGNWSGLNLHGVNAVSDIPGYFGNKRETIFATGTDYDQLKDLDKNKYLVRYASGR